MTTRDQISAEEYRARRDRVLKSLRGAAGVVLAGEGSAPRLGRWRADDFFFYLTGLRHEPSAAVLFDPSQPDPRRRCVLFLKPRDPDLEDWDGRRDPITSAMKARLGFDTVMRTWAMPRLLSGAARRTRRLACLHPFAAHNQPVSPDLSLYRSVAERMVGVSIEDRTDLLLGMRASKSPAERAMISRAIGITHEGLSAAIARIRPDGNEGEVHAAIEGAFREGGASGPAYDVIVASGARATVLHSIDNDAPLHDGDLVLIDAGAEFGGYAADLTRCFPVSGRFTDRQREIYGLVLKAQRASIRAVKPGATLAQVDAAARSIIEKAGYPDAFYHGIGHHLGLSVHDSDPDAPFVPGVVVTIEPGVYLKDEHLGIRLEDDILVTKDGRKNLSAAVPIEPDEVEAWMVRVQRGSGGKRA